MPGQHSAPRKKTGLSAKTLGAISHADLEQYSTEHIYIEDELGGTVEEPRTVSSKTSIRNRVKGIVAELTFYREGFLRVRAGTVRKPLKDYLLELRFIDPAPVRRHRLATRCLLTSIGMALAAVSAWILLPMSGLAPYTFSATVLLATMAVVALLMFIHRSDETHVFYTAVGKTEVLVLTASFGCLGRCRRAVKAVQGAVKGSQGSASARQDIRYLKAEMKAHYRLAETGVITRQACSEGTSLILARFG
ncbi:MAG: hypothetical protein OEW35_09705 [Gammaproteobacteria bacterium]|nr:hypothetical protein [Gammaproteobacteria bacterium]MDH4253639.1 hypothetical protein [Gammaproteobacteria bacterium]MDH5309755.1 hypothetical protein [Gammaproteobacteria bacterium]